MVERDARLVTSDTVQIGGDAPLQVSLTLTLPPRIVPAAVAKAAARMIQGRRDMVA